MNDQERPDHESRFDDPADAWVRDLLAEARVTEPVPDDVAARLDATLASLRAERADGAEKTGDTAAAEPAVVVPLRRRLAPVLAAAAAVVVVAAGGVGVVTALRDNSGSDSNASSAAADSAESADGRSLTSQPPADTLSGTAPNAGAAATLPRLSTTAFAEDAARVMRSLATAPTSATTGEPSPAPTGASPSEEQAPKAYAALEAPPVTTSPVTTSPDAADLDRSPAACAGPQVADAVTVPATLDGAPVALVFRPPTATAQQVEAWSCDGATLLASASVPH